jgi:pSer/pThr/pTyr-binding forkhead associated (FHA) protein
MPPGARTTLEHRTVVGRDDACDFVVLDARVSRRHLEIEPDGATLRFRDLGSSNGTSVNGKSVDSGELGLGDVVAIGDSELCIEPDEP